MYIYTYVRINTFRYLHEIYTGTVEGVRCTGPPNAFHLWTPGSAGACWMMQTLPKRCDTGLKKYQHHCEVYSGIFEVCDTIALLKHGALKLVSVEAPTVLRAFCTACKYRAFQVEFPKDRNELLGCSVNSGNDWLILFGLNGIIICTYLSSMVT